MTTKIVDELNKRLIIKDYENQELDIIGDFSSSSITTHWVVNKFNMVVPTGIFITLESAQDFCKRRNIEHKTDTFIVIKRTIFV